MDWQTGQLVRLRATAGRLSVLIAANQREAAAAAEQLAHVARRPLARRRHRRQTGHRDRTRTCGGSPPASSTSTCGSCPPRQPTC
jgi:hypothetical protein